MASTVRNSYVNFYYFNKKQVIDTNYKVKEIAVNNFNIIINNKNFD